MLLLSAFLLTGCGAEGLGENGDEGNATHNAGRNCNNSGCHSFAYAGTIYTTSAGTTAVSGAVIVIHDTGGDITLTSNSAGNFYTTTGTPSSGYLVDVTSGSNSQSKSVGFFINGGCNKSSCHVSGNQGRIYTNTL